jgi:outer membrane protein assembly factor BamB
LYQFCSWFFSWTAYGKDWPQWRGPERNGISSETGWSKNWPVGGPRQVWKDKVGIGYSSESVASGHVYAMGNIDEVDHVYCLDEQTGKLVWEHTYPCSSKDPNGYLGTRDRR